MIVYFTGTGNSRHLARIASERLEDETVDATSIIKSGENTELYSDKPWVFITPVYGWQIPHLFEEFIKNTVFKGNRLAYFVINCGTDIGGAGLKVMPLCNEKNFIFKGVAEIWMPENYIALFSAPDAVKAGRIISEADIHMEYITSLISKNQSLPERKSGIIDKIKSGIVNSFFCKFMIRSKPFHTNDKCISCGWCAGACMLNNIRIVDGRPVWGDRCTHCMACICGCPKEAIEYGKRTKNKRRYYLK